MAPVIESLKKLQVLKDHTVSESCLTGCLNRSCSWSPRTAFEDGHSSGLMTLFFVTALLNHCPTIATFLLSSSHTLTSLLSSPALSQNAALFVNILLTETVSKYVPIPCLYAPARALHLLGAGAFLLPPCTGAFLYHSHNILGLNTCLAVFWSTCS